MQADPQVDPAAEEAVLGAVLISPERAAEVVASVQPDDFGDPRNRRVFEAIQALASRSEGVDMITLGDELAQRSALQGLGGRARLVELTNGVTSAAHLQHHLKIVSQRGALRRLRHVAQAIVNESAGVTPLNGNVAEFLDEGVERVIAAATTLTSGGPEFIEGDVGSLRKRIAAGPIEGLDGMRTGFADLDAIVCGIRPGDLVVIGARPSVGKTALLSCIAMNAALIEGSLPVLFYSVEMARDSIVGRMAAAHSGIDHYFLRTYKLFGSNRERVEAALEEIERLPIAIDDTRTQTIMSMRSSSRKFQQRKSLQCVAVDYLQLVEHRGSESRLHEVSAVSRGLKTIARELNVPVIAAAQLNRSADTQDRPRLSNLRESGTIEADADIVILLHQLGDDYAAGEPRTVEAIVAKNRNGPVGTAMLLFQPNLVRFVDAAPSFGPEEDAKSPSKTEAATDAEFPGMGDKGTEYHE